MVMPLFPKTFPGLENNFKLSFPGVSGLWEFIIIQKVNENSWIASVEFGLVDHARSCVQSTIDNKSTFTCSNRIMQCPNVCHVVCEWCVCVCVSSKGVCNTVGVWLTRPAGWTGTCRVLLWDRPEALYWTHTGPVLFAAVSPLENTQSHTQSRPSGEYQLVLKEPLHTNACLVRYVFRGESSPEIAQSPTLLIALENAEHQPREPGAVLGLSPRCPPHLPVQTGLVGADDWGCCAHVAWLVHPVDFLGFRGEWVKILLKLLIFFFFLSFILRHVLRQRRQTRSGWQTKKNDSYSMNFNYQTIIPDSLPHH